MVIRILFSIPLFFLLLSFQSVQAQILSVGQETEMTILEGTTFSLDKLILVPAKDYSIKNNSMTISKSGNNLGIKSPHSVYLFEHNPLPFSGRLIVGVENGEVSPSASYRIQLYDNLRWKSIETINSHHALFEGLAQSSLTKGITLLEREGKGDLKILTNPVVGKSVAIEVFIPGEYKIIGTDGKLLIKNNYTQGVHQVDMGKYSHGAYFITNGKTSLPFIL